MIAEGRSPLSLLDRRPAPATEPIDRPSRVAGVEEDRREGAFGLQVLEQADRDRDLGGTGKARIAAQQGERDRAASL